MVAQAQFAAEQPGEPQQARTQGSGRQADHQRRALPRIEHFCARQRHDDNQRQIAHLGKSVEPLVLITTGDTAEAAVAFLDDALEVGTGTEVGAGQVFAQARDLGQQDSILVDQADRAVGTDVQAVEQLFEVAQAHGRLGDAKELALSATDPATEADAPFVVGHPGAKRPADEHARVAVVHVGLKVLAVGKVACPGFS
ncbi:hypothetical protein D3C81_1638760 [compost metagenome]